MLDAAGDLAGRGALLLDRCSDYRRDLVQHPDRAADARMAETALAGRLLHRGNLGADLLGCARRLPGERLHFRRDHREPLAGLARTRRLDRRVEREQVRLPGDRIDHRDHLADLLRGTGELVDIAAARRRLAGGGLGGGGGARHLGRDLRDRGGELLRGGRDGLHVGRGLGSARGNRGGARGRLLRGDGHGLRGRLQLGGRGDHLLHHAADLHLEPSGEPAHLLGALDPPALLVLALRGGEAVGLDQTGLEHPDGLGHLADLVPAALVRHLGRQLAGGEAAHDAGHPADRARDAEHDREPGRRAEQHGKPDRGEGDDARREIDRFAAIGRGGAEPAGALHRARDLVLEAVEAGPHLARVEPGRVSGLPRFRQPEQPVARREIVLPGGGEARGDPDGLGASRHGVIGGERCGHLGGDIGQALALRRFGVRRGGEEMGGLELAVAEGERPDLPEQPCRRQVVVPQFRGGRVHAAQPVDGEAAERRRGEQHQHEGEQHLHADGEVGQGAKRGEGRHDRLVSGCLRSCEPKIENALRGGIEWASGSREAGFPWALRVPRLTGRRIAATTRGRHLWPGCPAARRRAPGRRPPSSHGLSGPPLLVPGERNDRPAPDPPRPSGRRLLQQRLVRRPRSRPRLP